MTGTASRLSDLLRRLSPPAAGECHVWRLPVVAGRWDAFADVLEEYERDRHRRFLRSADQDRYLTAHVGVRLLLGGYLDVPPRSLRFGRDCKHCGGDHGKPALRGFGTSLDFSLTHSGDWVAIAVAAAPVGVDVQEIEERTDIAAMSRMALSPSERDWLNGQPPERTRIGFFGYWARKEALLKATGHGLAIPMAKITLSPPDEPARLVQWAASAPLDSPVQLRDLTVAADYTGSVALLTAHPIQVVEAELPAPEG